MKKIASILLIVFMVIAMIGLTACVSKNPSENPQDDIPEPSESQRTIEVTVSDGEGVEGATVSVRSTDYSATTDANGKCSILLSSSDSSAEAYTLVIRKEGYIDATAKVSKDDFDDDKAEVSVTIYSENITIHGIVKDGENPLEGVLVAISFDEATVTTNDQGEYSLTVARPIEGFDVTFSKQFYVSKSVSVSEINGKDFTVNADLVENSFNVSGTVSHYFNGAIEGATVEVEGTSLSVVTDKAGHFEISDISGLELPYLLVITRQGSQKAVVKVNEDNASIDVELVDEAINLGTLSPSNKSYDMSVVRDSKGIWFYFESLQQFVAGDKICIYIDVNESGNVALGSSVIEFALCGDCDTEGNPIALVWNLKTSQSVTATAEIAWGEEVKYILNNSDNGSYITAFISYDTFAKAGEEFAIDKNSVVGISFFDRSQGSQGASGWDSEAFPGYDGANWVHPDCPKDYVRLAPENIVYEAADNNYIPYIDYNIVINVKDEQGNAISSATVAMTHPYEISKVLEEGKASFILNGIYFNKEPSFTISAEGYNSSIITIERSEFVEGMATIEVTLKEKTVLLSDTGKVVSLSGALEGVTVSVKGYEGSVLTDANGVYDLSVLNIDAKNLSSYTIVLIKSGYVEKSVEVVVGVSVGDINMYAEARNLGTFGQYAWNVTIDRNDDKLIVDLVSDKNWYGKTDIDGNATATENELQIYFVTNLNAKEKTADGLRELTIVEKVSQGGTDWAGWRDGNRTFLDWPGIIYSVTNSDSGCKVHIEVAYTLLGIEKGDTIGFAVGEWYGQAAPAWSCPFYTDTTQSFVSTGWAVNINDPSSSIHWAADNSTKVVYVA